MVPEWVAYVDESGSGIGIKTGKSRFVLACVVGSTKALDELDEKIRRLKLELAPNADPANWELHAGEMFHGRGDSPLGSMSTERNMRVMRKIMGIVCGCDVVLFTIVVTGARMHGKRVTHTKITEHATALLIERLDRFAAEREDKITLRVVSDNVLEGNRLSMKRALARRAARRSGACETRRVTGITFVDSRSSALVQVADAIAYIINRYVGGDTAFAEMLEGIERKTRHAYGVQKGSVRRFE